MKYAITSLIFFLCTGSHAYVVQTGQKRIDTAMSVANAEATSISRRSSIFSLVAASSALLQFSSPASARLEAVNRPDLLPSEAGLNVIQTERFLTNGQARRMDNMLASLEKDTGFRLRVLCQNYPNTPGLAIRDYWDLGKEVRRAHDREV